MEARVNLAAVGAFVLLLGGALIAGVLWLSSPKSYRKSYDTYVVYMTESVSGLSVDAPVRYRGVAVGAVRSIALATRNTEEVELLLDIEQDTPVKEDTVAVLQTQGLTGIGHIELSGGTRAAAELRARPGEPYAVIRAGRSFMARIDSDVSALAASVQRSSESLNALLGEENRKALGATLAHLELLSRELAARSRSLDAAVAATTKTMQNTASASAELAPLLARAQAGLAAMERGATAVERSVEALARGGAAIERMAERGAQAGSDASAALEEAQSLAAELRELAASLRRFSAELERNPSMLLHGRPAARPGPGE